MNRIRLVGQDIIAKFLSNNKLILEQFGDICYVLQKKSSGSVIPLSAISGSQYTDSTNTRIKIWDGNPGEVQNLNHPDTRYDANAGLGFITVEKDGVELDRIAELSTLSDSSEYRVNIDVDGSVYVNLYSSGSVIEVGYSTLCYCVDPQRSQGMTNCEVCYGTMYEGGYDVFGGVETGWNPSGTVLIRVPPAFADTKVESVRNLRTDEQNEAWCLADPDYPVINDYDVILPMTGDHSGSCFEVTNVRMSHLRDHNLSQRFQVHNIEENDVIYSFPLPVVSGSYTIEEYLQARAYANI